MILREGGAKIVQRLYSDSEDRIDCIVCDKHPGPEVSKIKIIYNMITTNE